MAVTTRTCTPEAAPVVREKGAHRRVERKRPARRQLESRARSRALQALYAWDIRNAAAPSVGPGSRSGENLLRMADEVWNDLGVPPEERRMATTLVSIIARNASTIDTELTDVTANWRLERLGAIERAVLRLGVAELTGTETPPRVAIHEAIRLAERFGSLRSARFVNGVLDAVARRTGRL